MRPSNCLLSSKLFPRNYFRELGLTFNYVELIGIDHMCLSCIDDDGVHCAFAALISACYLLRAIRMQGICQVPVPWTWICTRMNENMVPLVEQFHR